MANSKVAKAERSRDVLLSRCVDTPRGGRLRPRRLRVNLQKCSAPVPFLGGGEEGQVSLAGKREKQTDRTGRLTTQSPGCTPGGAA